MFPRRIVSIAALEERLESGLLFGVMDFFQGCYSCTSDWATEFWGIIMHLTMELFELFFSKRDLFTYPLL